MCIRDRFRHRAESLGLRAPEGTQLAAVDTGICHTENGEEMLDALKNAAKRGVDVRPVSYTHLDVYKRQTGGVL